MTRRFRTRNGSIIEAIPHIQDDTRCAAGVTGYLRVISSTDPIADPGDELYLCVRGCDLPEGGAFGPGWDVIEEIFDLRQETLEEDARDILEESRKNDPRRD